MSFRTHFKSGYVHTDNFIGIFAPDMNSTPKIMPSVVAGLLVGEFPEGLYLVGVSVTDTKTEKKVLTLPESQLLFVPNSYMDSDFTYDTD